MQKTRSQGKFRRERTHSTRSRHATMLDGQTQLTAMFGAPERKAPQPPAPVVTPPGSRSKRKWAPANAIPPLALPPLKSPKKAVPPGWMRYGLAPALRRCDECGDDVVGAFRRPDGDFSFRRPPDSCIARGT